MCLYVGYIWNTRCKNGLSAHSPKMRFHKNINLQNFPHFLRLVRTLVYLFENLHFRRMQEWAIYSAYPILARFLITHKILRIFLFYLHISKAWIVLVHFQKITFRWASYIPLKLVMQCLHSAVRIALAN